MYDGILRLALPYIVLTDAIVVIIQRRNQEITSLFDKSINAMHHWMRWGKNMSTVKRLWLATTILRFNPTSAISLILSNFTLINHSNYARIKAAAMISSDNSNDERPSRCQTHWRLIHTDTWCRMVKLELGVTAAFRIAPDAMKCCPLTF